MNGPLPTLVTVLSLALAAWAVVLLIRNKPVGRALVVGVGVLEVVLVALVVSGIAQMIGSSRDFSLATFVGYLLGAAAIPPIAALWSLDESDRYGTTVLLVALLVMPVMILRLQQVWAGPVG